MSTSKTALAVSTTRHITAMPISTGLPRQSLIFCRLLFRVMIFREIRLPAASASTFRAALPPPSTSPLWLSRVLAAGFTPEQKGLT